jgi:predicted PurR-regulated permease PerM
MTSPPWSSRTKRIVVLITLLIGGILLWQVADVLPILVVAAVLTFLLNPLTNTLERTFGGRRGLSILVTFIFILILFAVALLVIFPTLFNELQNFIDTLPELIEEVRASAEEVLNQPIVLFGQVIIPAEQLDQFLGTPENGEALQSIDLIGAARSFMGSLTGPAFSIVGSAFRTIINLVFLLTLMFYLLRDNRRFYQALVEFTAPTYRDDVRRLLYELGQVWNAYLRGQLILCIFIGVVVFIAATALGVPNPLVLGLIAGVLEFVPNLGPLLALVPAALLALVSQSNTLPFLEGPTFALVVIVVWTLIQNIEALVIVPRVMGGSLNLHPVVVIVGVLAGASFAGALGVILAAPAIASVRLLLHYIYGKVTDQQVFPPLPARITPSPSRPSLLHGVRSRFEDLFGG